ARAARALGAQHVIAHQLAWSAIAEGRLDDAESQLRKAAGPSHWGSAPAPVVLLALGHVCLMRGDLDKARVVYRRAVLRVQDAEPGGMTRVDALLDMAGAEDVAGLFERAQRLIGANEAWYAAHGGAGRVWRPYTRNPLKRGLVPIPPAPTDPALVKARSE